MKHVQRRHRPDANSKAIIEAARKAGAMVIPIGRPVDLLIGWGGQWRLIETKAAKGKYTMDQQFFLYDCLTLGLPVLTWRSVEDAIAAINGSCA